MFPFFHPILTMVGSNCLNMFTEKRSLPHLRLFLALLKTFKGVYNLEHVVQSLSGSESLQAGKAHPSQLLETCASRLLSSLYDEALLQSRDVVELHVEVAIWIAIHTGQVSHGAKIFFELCQVCDICCLALPAMHYHSYYVAVFHHLFCLETIVCMLYLTCHLFRGHVIMLSCLFAVLLYSCSHTSLQYSL